MPQTAQVPPLPPGFDPVEAGGGGGGDSGTLTPVPPLPPGFDPVNDPQSEENVRARHARGSIVSRQIPGKNYGDGPETGVLPAMGRAGASLIDLATTNPKTTLKNLVAAQGEQFEKAHEAPTLSEKAGYTAAGLLPVAGPMAAQAGEEIGNRDFGGGLVDAGLAVGTGRGMVKGGGRLLSKVAKDPVTERVPNIWHAPSAMMERYLPSKTAAEQISYLENLVKDPKTSLRVRQQAQSILAREKRLNPPPPVTPMGPTRVNPPNQPPNIPPEPVTPYGPTRVNPPGAPPNIPPEHVTPMGPTRVNPEDIAQRNHVTPMGPTRVNHAPAPRTAGVPRKSLLMQVQAPEQQGHAPAQASGRLAEIAREQAEIKQQEQATQHQQEAVSSRSPGKLVSLEEEGPGNRPGGAERSLTEIVRRPIVTPEEAQAESRALGSRAKLQPGEGTMGRQARLLGLVRARRAGAGMPEPQEPLQGGHAGGGVASEEEINRPGVNYTVSESGVTHHGKAFAPEGVRKGQAHVTVQPNGEVRVNAGELTPKMKTKLRQALGPEVEF